MGRPPRPVRRQRDRTIIPPVTTATSTVPPIPISLHIQRQRTPRIDVPVHTQDPRPF